MLLLRGVFFLLCMVWSITSTTQNTLEIGPGKPYSTLTEAVGFATPGDTLLLFPAPYTGGLYIADLQGLPNAWITIRGEGPDPVTIQGGTNAIQFTNPAYLVIENLRFTGQTGNGLNIDDGGDYATPAHHVILRHCVFDVLDATGNNDQLKLSGLDSFLVASCTFRDGSSGGSGIDMVGCHWGRISDNVFTDQGSNSIQAKGGSRYIYIQANRFIQGGQRGINLGGSTGAPFFRPLGANYEAADLQVVGNLFVGCTAPIAYVGSQRVQVWNNTLLFPEKWVLRILQESSDTSFYQAVADGEFVNNIILIDDQVSTTVNIGPNTNAASFSFRHNLWWHTTDSNWNGPNLPAMETGTILQSDPQFVDLNTLDIRLLPGSPALSSGAMIPDTSWRDLDQQPFFDPPSRGALEDMEVSTTEAIPATTSLRILPNPATDWIQVPEGTPFPQVLVNMNGEVVSTRHAGDTYWHLPALPPGAYWFVCTEKSVEPFLLFIQP